MKKKTAILLVGAFVFTAAFSGCGKNKKKKQRKLRQQIRK